MIGPSLRFHLRLDNECVGHEKLRGGGNMQTDDIRLKSDQLH